MPYSSRPTLDDLLTDSDVDNALKTAWIDSNPDAPEVLLGQAGSEKAEQGGFIYWNKQTGELEVERLPAGKRDGLEGFPQLDTDERVLVGSFHTHPNTVAEGYTADPSITDKMFTRRITRVPEIIETHDGRKIIPYP